jgi:hypothetical protein
MTLKMTKPGTKPDDFIKAAKADQTPTNPDPGDDLFKKNYKTFPLRLPLALRDTAIEKARAAGLTLHDYILLAIRDKNG